MVQLARGFARAQRDGAPVATRWRAPFATMSRGVRILSRLQIPPETLARLRGYTAAQNGIAIVLQGRGIVPHLTVEDFPAIVTMDAHGNSLHKDVEQQSAQHLETIGV